MFLLLAGILILGFVVNVTLGAVSGSPILGDVGEMLLLLTASVVFVVAILKRESAEKQKINS